jgi:hypothetical protein
MESDFGPWIYLIVSLGAFYLLFSLASRQSVMPAQWQGKLLEDH